MKSALIISSLFLLVHLSCKNQGSIKDNPKKDSIATTAAPKTVSNLDTAKVIAARIFEYVEQAETKKITKKRLKQLADPLQARLDSFRKVLSPSDVDKLDTYRSQLVNDMVDRKVIRDRQ